MHFCLSMGKNNLFFGTSFSLKLDDENIFIYLPQTVFRVHFYCENCEKKRKNISFRAMWAKSILSLPRNVYLDFGSDSHAKTRTLKLTF